MGVEGQVRERDEGLKRHTSVGAEGGLAGESRIDRGK